MNFDEFQAAFVKENRKLKIIIFLMIIVFGFGSVFNIINRRYYLYKGGAIFEERPLVEEICRLGFVSLAEGEPNPYVVSTGLIKAAKNDQFRVMVDKLLLVKSTEVDTCKIILKSEGKLVAFKVSLSGTDENSFYYKLTQLDETLAEKEKR